MSLMNKNPPHPGDYVWSALIEPRRITVKAAAEMLGVSHVALSNLINRHSNLSPQMALRIEKVFGAELETLLYMQAVWDAAKVRRSSKDLRLTRYSEKRVVIERNGKRGRDAMCVIDPRKGTESSKEAPGLAVPR
jgi:addiction module HigA family antidote